MAAPGQVVGTHADPHRDPVAQRLAEPVPVVQLVPLSLGQLQRQGRVRPASPWVPVARTPRDIHARIRRPFARVPSVRTRRPRVVAAGYGDSRTGVDLALRAAVCSLAPFCCIPQSHRVPSPIDFNLRVVARPVLRRPPEIVLPCRICARLRQPRPRSRVHQPPKVRAGEGGGRLRRHRPQQAEGGEHNSCQCAHAAAQHARLGRAAPYRPTLARTGPPPRSRASPPAPPPRGQRKRSGWAPPRRRRRRKPLRGTKMSGSGASSAAVSSCGSRSLKRA